LSPEQWAAQGHEVRGILAYDVHEGRLLVRVAWEDSWQPACDLVGPELQLFQQRLAAAGDATDVVGRAQRELALAEQQAEADEVAMAGRQQRQRTSSRRVAARPSTTA
jgi:hypothetical protein